MLSKVNLANGSCLGNNGLHAITRITLSTIEGPLLLVFMYQNNLYVYYMNKRAFRLIFRMVKKKFMM